MKFYAEFYRRFETKYKALSLSKAKDFLKNNLKTKRFGRVRQKFSILLDNEWDKN